MYDNYRSHTFGVFNVHEDRDRSRAAAERYFLLQAVAERRPTTVARKWSGLRRLLAFSPAVATQPGRAEA